MPRVQRVDTACSHLYQWGDQAYEGSGRTARYDCPIEIAGGRIREVTTGPSPKGTQRVEVVAPGIIDLQINGAADVQFNDDPSPEAVARLAEGARQGGAAHVLPTFITAEGDAGTTPCARSARRWPETRRGCSDLHLEGPFLSPKKPDIHPASAIRPATKADLSLLERAGIPLLLTLAPEEQPAGTIRRLSEAGIVVFAGHSSATVEQLPLAAKEGLCGVTHLWNAMPPAQGRTPGMVVRTLTHPRLFAGIIADGFHVDPLNPNLAARMMPDRLFTVTDAMRTFAGAVPSFDLMGAPVTLQDGRLTGSDRTLASAHVYGSGGACHGRGCRCRDGNYGYATPAKIVGLEKELGRVAPGYRASLAFLDAAVHAGGALVEDARLFDRRDGREPSPRSPPAAAVLR